MKVYFLNYELQIWCCIQDPSEEIGRRWHSSSLLPNQLPETLTQGKAIPIAETDTLGIVLSWKSTSWETVYNIFLEEDC
jgi:hypothetical protein